MKKFFKASALIVFAIVLLTATGCKKKTQGQKDNQEPLPITKESNHQWYYFTQDGFSKTDKPSLAPILGALPYTEAVRISSANNAAGATEENSGKAYALVNRLGVLCFNGTELSLAKDISVFSDRTAVNLVFVNDTPVFSVYKSAFFNGSIDSSQYKKDNSSHLFLIQFDETTNISYPIINCSNLGDVSNGEVTDFYWDGNIWFCCLKTMSGNQQKTDFSYLKFTPAAPLLSISPVSASNLISVQEANVKEFREAMRVRDYSIAPERIRKMLRGFASEIPFTLEVKAAGGASPRVYENVINASDEQELNAKAIIAQSWSAVLFEDGTFYIEGALPGKHILRGGKTIAIRLPKLEKGYIYSDFVISGTTLYAAWEETDFYKVRRSGFLSVDLDSTLYNKLR